MSSYVPVSEDVFEANVVCHALGNTFYEVGVRARPHCKCMDNLAPNGNREGNLVALPFSVKRVMMTYSISSTMLDS